jgi:aldehyde:ferredoxin oxidoreductase
MDQYKIKRYGCHSCNLRCGALIKLDEGRFATEGEIHRPEYETLAALGSNCFNDNIEVVIKANEICNLYGIDTIGVGGAISFAMECWDKGLITESDTDGMDLSWGNGESIVAITEQIARREGFGALLADGSKIAAEKIGKGSEEYAMQVGGQGLPYHDPRLSPIQGTVYFAEANPGRHIDSFGNSPLEKGGSLGADPVLSGPELEMYGDYNSKGSLMSVGVPFLHFYSSAGMCVLFLLANTVPVVEYIAAVTGWKMDAAEAIKTGKRIATLRQAFNVREGLKPEDFKMPKRFFKALSVGPAAGQEVDFDTIKASYYESMGWDIKSGSPFPQTLKELGLDTLV